MTEKQTTEILLPSNTALVVRNGQVQVRFEFNAQGGVDIHSNAPVSVYSPVGKDEPLVRVPQIGEPVEHGWKYGGVSIVTNSPLFVAPKDEPVTKTWGRAVNDAAALKGFMGYDGSQQKTEDLLLEALAKGTDDHGVRVPTAEELDKNLYANCDAIGGFNRTGSNPAGWYWSSTQHDDYGARDQRFSDGRRNWRYEHHRSSVRLVRS